MTTRITISGSFQKHYAAITKAIDEFVTAGADVLSPAKGRILNPKSEFSILTTDTTDDIKLLEQRHLAAIKCSDILYVCNHGGYIGVTVGIEIGWAMANGKEVVCSETPSDVLPRSLLTKIMSPNATLEWCSAARKINRSRTI